MTRCAAHCAPRPEAQEDEHQAHHNDRDSERRVIANGGEYDPYAEAHDRCEHDESGEGVIGDARSCSLAQPVRTRHLA